ncbi:MAG: FAD-binding protein [Deltaproteobacteria bacterium]|nr:FAD-binding protein [Deltaproteobacteria bacterium]
MASIYQKLASLLGKRALGEPDAMEPYGRDESDLKFFPPEAVALVQSGEEIREVLHLADLDGIFVTPRGLGSGKTGGALPVKGGIVLSTERMRGIHQIDAENLLAVVEPGVVTGDLISRVEEEGLFYPPDPASLDVCSLGGNVAENAGGPRAFKYGVTREYVLGLELALMGGEGLSIGRRTVKGVTGMDLVALITGSEGTLAVISEITLKLLPRPQRVETFLAVFGDVLSAGRAVSQMIRDGHRPRTLELLDEQVVEHLAEQGKWPLPSGTAALLLVELDGEEGLEAQLLRAAQACEASGAREILVATDEARRRTLWEMRRQVSTMLGEMHRFRVAEDVAVPRAAISEMLSRLHGLAREFEVGIATYGHAGDGNLHVNVVYDEEIAAARVESLIEAIFRHALDLGGTLSGEHGIGVTKRRYMHLEQSPALLALQQKLKGAFDPRGLLNPGKLLP